MTTVNENTIDHLEAELARITSQNESLKDQVSMNELEIDELEDRIADLEKTRESFNDN